MRRSLRWTWSIVPLLVLSACRREEVRVYEAPRDPAAPPMTADATPATPSAATPAPGAGTATPSVPWVVPSDWSERPNSSGMRVASYGVSRPDGREMDVSVVALGEQAGSVLDNINRWRRELELPPIEETGLDSVRTPIRIGGREGFLYDLVSAGPIAGASAPVRTLAAMLPAGGMTVFFKAKGDAALVAEQRANVIAWLASVQTGPSDRSREPAPAATAPAAAPGTPSWTAPTHWRDAGPRPMRTASFEIPGDAGASGDVSISSLGGDGGGPLANVNRWRGQVGLAPLDPAGLESASTRLPLAGGRSAVLVDLDGGAQRILAAIVPDGDRTWFFKLTAPPALVERERAGFVAFVESVRF